MEIQCSARHGSRAFVFIGGHFSLASVDASGATVALALARLEHRPFDYLPQPVGNVWVLCTAGDRRREGIGEAILRLVLMNLRAAGAASATIQSDLGSAFESHRM